MINKRKNWILALVTIQLSISTVQSRQNSEVEDLSPKLRAILSKEMAALQEGMMALIPAQVTGNDTEVANIAKRMKNSYVLKQELTLAQKHELHVKLSDSFLDKDEAFHDYAGKLEQAASNHNSELISFYYSKLLGACVSCHRQHAQDKFPKFASGEKRKEHSH